MTATPTADTLKILQAKFPKKTFEIAQPFIEKFAAIDISDLATLDNFLTLLDLYLSGTPPYIRADRIKSLKTGDRHIVFFEATADFASAGKTLLNQLAVIKLNGGLGTSMGCSGAKSAIPIDTHKQYTFLDAIARQLKSLQGQLGISVPLWLLNSFYTQADTASLLAHFPYHELIQHQFPRLDIRDPNHPVPLIVADDPKSEWYPPGHGDVFTVFSKYDWIAEQLRNGKQFCFISNADNLGATIDAGILGYMAAKELDFVMETTPKAPADTKGGSLIAEEDGHLDLLEIAQVDPKDPLALSAFQRLPIFNTNNIWIRLTALQQMLSDGLKPTLIQNRKTVHGIPVLQLEHAMGAAISAFEKSATVVVPRTRFIPVKTTSDLLILRSDLYIKSDDGTVFPNPNRNAALGVPLVQLGVEFHTVADLERRIHTDTSLLEMETLMLCGNIFIDRGVRIKGHVRIEVQTGYQLQVAAGTLLDTFTLQVPGSAPVGFQLTETCPGHFILK